MKLISTLIAIAFASTLSFTAIAAEGDAAPAMAPAAAEKAPMKKAHKAKAKKAHKAKKAMKGDAAAK